MIISRERDDAFSLNNRMVVTLKTLLLQPNHKKSNEAESKIEIYRLSVLYHIVRVIWPATRQMLILICLIYYHLNEYRQNSQAIEMYSEVFLIKMCLVLHSLVTE